MVTVLYRVTTIGAVIYRFDCTYSPTEQLLILQGRKSIRSKYKITKVKEFKILPDRPRGKFCSSSGAAAEKLKEEELTSSLTKNKYNPVN